jgi:HSP20 family molecular chaperone IbpA
MNTIEKKTDDRANAVSPPIDVYENEQEFLLVADLPGVSQGEAEVSLEEDRLVVKAGGATRKYHRELIVPPSVDGEHVSAAMKAGVLTVHLPKRAPYRPRQIEVRGT